MQRITKSNLERMVAELNEMYDIELILHISSPDGGKNYYQLRERLPKSHAETGIGPTGDSREVYRFMQGIKFANNNWVKQ